MLDSLGKKVITLGLTTLFATIFLFSASAVSASEIEGEKEKTVVTDTAAKEKSVATEAPAKDKAEDNADGKETGQATISYILFANALKVEPSSEIRPRFAKDAKSPSEPETSGAQSGQQLPVPRRDTVASAPLTPGEKFRIFYTGSFLSRGAYISPLFNGAFNELLDNDENKDDTVGSYFGDVGTRAARSFAFGTTSRFLQDFALASAFKQDPRYHRVPTRTYKQRILYAVSRVFVTRGDNGNDQPNVSFLLGGAMTAAISNVWEPEENRTWRKSLSRWAFNIGFGALGNIGAELLGGQ